MSKTVELPEKLVAELNSLAARENRLVDDVVAELIQVGLEARTYPDKNDTSAQAETRLLQWFALADELMQDAPAGPTARQILEEDRNRLEHH